MRLVRTAIDAEEKAILNLGETKRKREKGGGRDAHLFVQRKHKYMIVY